MTRARSPASVLLREMFAELSEYRELLAEVTRRDLLLRYKQTVMGFGWAILAPVLNTAIFSIIFTRVARIDVGMPYPVFAFCGLLAWNFFASSLRFSVTSLTSNVALVTKVYFPREILPLSAVLVSLVDFAVASLVLVLLMAYYGIAPSWALAALPVVILVHVIFTCAMALALAMGNLFYRDVKFIFEVVIQIWLFATAVLYPLDSVGGRLGFLLGLNPLTPIIQGYRDVILLGRLPGADFAVAAAASVLLAACSWVAFHRAEFKFAESI